LLLYSSCKLFVAITPKSEFADGTHAASAELIVADGSLGDGDFERGAEGAWADLTNCL